MALKKLIENGYGQLELNLVAFRRDGRIAAQCKLDADDFADRPAENGMLLAVDELNRSVKLPVDGSLPIALNYTTEHMYDERDLYSLSKFCLNIKDGFYPRLGYLAIGDKFTSNCICADSTEFADLDALKKATGELYGGACAEGYIKVSATKPTFGPVLRVIKRYTMPDGQFGIKFQCVETNAVAPAST